MNGKSISIWFLTLVLFGVFATAGLAKLLNASQIVDAFQRFGYSDNFRVLVGFGEIAGAVALLMPRTAAASAWFLLCIMLGATWTYLTLHEYGAAVAPVTVGLLCLCLAFARRPASFKRPQIITMRELDRLWELESQFESVRGGR